MRASRAASELQETDAAPGAIDRPLLVNRICHLIVLTKEGKVETAVDTLVLALLATDPTLSVSSAAELADAIEVYFGVRLNESLLEAALDRHVSAGRILRGPAANYFLAPHTRAEVEQRINDAARLEDEVRQEWIDSLPDECKPRAPNVEEQLWAALRQYLAVAFLRHGAETAQLLDPSYAAADPVGTSLSRYRADVIKDHCIDIHPALADQALRHFFRTTTPSRTKYMAQLLDGTFTVFALGVDDLTARYFRAELSPLKLFLDTNFIFGILDISDNPLKEVSRDLVEVIRRHQFPYKLYYHEETLREIRDTLQAIGDRLRGRKWQQALSRAAVSSGLFAGIELLFHLKNSEKPIEADLFLARFDDVPALLARFGASIYRARSDRSQDETEKWTQIADYDAFLKQRRPDRPKLYPALNHDVVVWRQVLKIRAAGGSVLDAKALFLSADYYFYRFTKQYRNGANAGSVVLPNQLLQLLRPFIASSDDFDRRFVETFALPEMRALPGDYSSTASKVLAYLNTVADLGQDTALRVLSNTMVSARLATVEEGSAAFQEIIDSELARDNQILVDQVKSATVKAENAESQVGELKGLVDRQEAEITALGAKLNDTQAKLDQSTRDAGIALEGVETEKSSVETRLRASEQQIQDLIAQQHRQSDAIRWSFAALVAVVGSVALLLLLHVLNWRWLEDQPNRLGLKVAVVMTWIGICWAVVDKRHRLFAVGGMVLAVIVGVLPILGR
jgi:hypothetical protein